MVARVTRAAFPAMSVTVEITGVGVPEREIAHAVAHGRALAERWEALFSRFRPHSQLCRLNAAAGAPVRVADDFLALLETAKAAVSRTGGRFDPSILPALEAAGYDRSIERVLAAPSRVPEAPRLAAGPAGWERVRIDHGRSEAQLPPGMRIDLSGIAKGAFVDRLAAALASWPGGSVDAGGDVRVWGEPPSGDHWRIGIEDPFHPAADLLVADVFAGGIGVATSATHRRRWAVGARIANHLIDPATGLPLGDAIRAVTAFAPDVTSAEIATKALIVAASGPTNGQAFGAAAAVVVAGDGTITTRHEEPPDGSHIAFVWPSAGAA